MIRLGKVRCIASFEFLCTVKRKGYLIATFGMPVFLLLYGLLVSVPAYFSAKKDAETKIYGVVDHAGVLALQGDATVSLAEEIPEEVRSLLQSSGQEDALDRGLAMRGNSVFRPFEEEAVARQALLAEEIRGYFVLPEDFVEQGMASAYFGEGQLGTSDPKRHFRSLILDKLLEGNVPPQLAERVRKPVAAWNEWTLNESGELTERSVFAVLVRILIPLLFAVLLLFSILSSAGYLSQGTGIEKENKVVEVLLSCAHPEEILTGKLLGLGGAGLVQVSVWFSMLIVAGFTFAATLAEAGVEIPWAAIAASFAFFVAAYLFIGSLMLGTGSLGSNQRESQQWSMIWGLLPVIPLVFLMMFIKDPNSMGVYVMTWIPFTAPLTVILRMTLESAKIAWWEIGGSFLVLVLSTYLAIQVGARLFRVGLLLTGTRPKLREILRQAKLGN